jgi:hypothetical protein
MLNSTLKVSSVQDKKQYDPEEAAAKGKTTWGKWVMEQQQKPLFVFFFFMPGEDQGVAPVLAPG